MRKDVEEKRRMIIKTIINKGALGISEIIKEVGYDKKTVIKYCHQLESEGMIRKNGRFGKYYPTNNLFRYPSLRANKFQVEAIRQIFQTLNESYYNQDKKDLENDNQAFSLFLLNFFYRKQLSEFSDKVGSYIAYCLIQSMAPKSWNPKIDNVPLEGVNPRKNKDTAITEWVKNPINPLRFLVEFSNLEMVEAGLPTGTAVAPPPLHVYLQDLNSPIYSDLTEKKKLEQEATRTWQNHKKWYERKKRMDFDPRNEYQSMFELNEEVYNGLIKAYEELYPHMYKKLEKIKNGIDDHIKRDISLTNDPKHIKCKGEMRLISEDKIRKFEQCIECKRYFSYTKS